MWFWNNKNKTKSEFRNVVSIRMEAIGGQGANSAGKILAEAAVLKQGYTGNHFSSFGSEKRGTPVKSFVRFSTKKDPVRTASSISNPNVLVVFHENLIKSHPEILEGANENTDLVINTKLKHDQLFFPQGLRFRSIAIVDATEIARKKQCGVNAVMLGALSVFCPEILTDSIAECLRDFFKHRGPQISESNLKGFESGVSQTHVFAFEESQANRTLSESALPQMGWMNAPIGGVITNPGNSVLKDHSASRKGVAPQLTKEICFNCGFCDMVCPDFCFVWEIDASNEKPPNLLGIDYQYCKGCQKCIAVCPVEALNPVLESDIPESEKNFHAYPEVNRQEISQRWRHLDWTAFVDRLSDQDRMGTLQTELLDPKTYLRPDFSDEILAKTKGKKS